MNASSWPLIGLSAAIVLACLCLAWSNASQPIGPAAAPSAPPGGLEELGRQIIEGSTQAFRPSLEMRENVDFLLTPALVVQEAMSEDVLITYPWE
jgi:hypothetical protein